MLLLQLTEDMNALLWSFSRRSINQIPRIIEIEYFIVLCEVPLPQLKG
jgi:hypothetical protein